MASIIGNTKPLSDIVEQGGIKPASKAVPQGIGAAKTTLESAEPTPKSEKIIEPGVFETIVVAIKDFIVFLFKSLWSCLCRKPAPIEKAAPEQKKEAPSSRQAMEISLLPSKSDL